MELFLKLCWWCVVADYRVTLMHSQTHRPASLRAARPVAALLTALLAALLTAFAVRFPGSEFPTPASSAPRCPA